MAAVRVERVFRYGVTCIFHGEYNFVRVAMFRQRSLNLAGVVQATFLSRLEFGLLSRVLGPVWDGSNQAQ